MKCIRRYAFAVLCLTASLLHAEPGNVVTVAPGGYDRGIRNPMMGFTADKGHPWASLKHVYIRWNELENDESDGIERIYAVSNQKFSGLAEHNIKVIPRVHLQYFADDRYWPADMTADDYTSQQFQDRVVRLIGRLGTAWDDDPRVAFVELGIVGLWGEHHSPAPTPEIQKIIGDAFAAAFKNKKVSVRQNWDDFTESNYPFGEYWDSWAHYDQMWNNGNSIADLNEAESRHLTNYVGGEVAYDWGSWDTQPGSSPTDSVSDPVHRKFVINSMRWLHCTQLRWISGYNKDDPTAAAGAEEIQKAFGYRFKLDEVRVSMDESLAMAFDVTNEGSAPFYHNWPVEVALLDPTTLEPVWSSIMQDADVRNWHPGSGWTAPDWTVVGGWRGRIPHPNWNSSGITGWATPPQTHTVQGTFQVDAPAGNYVLSLAVLDPAGNLPSLRFATSNYINGGRHPIAQVNTATGESSALPSDFAFDDMRLDQSLQYDPNPNSRPVYHSLGIDSQNGSVALSPAVLYHLDDTEVTLTATPDEGYEFLRWSGDATGTTESTTVLMDARKSVRANFARAAIPGLIEAEGYRSQSGIQTENRNDGGGHIGYVNNGDWVEYRFTVPEAGDYLVSLHVSNKDNNGGVINILTDGQALGSVVAPHTGGWSTWQTVNTVVNFTKRGAQTMRLSFSGRNGYLLNFDWMNFSKVSSNTLISEQRIQMLEEGGEQFLGLTFLRPIGGSASGATFTAAGRLFTIEASLDLAQWDEEVEVAPHPPGLPAPEIGHEWASYRLKQPAGMQAVVERAFIRVKVKGVAEP